MYVAEGVPVEKGDLLARLKSPSAIRAASEADRAGMQLELATRDKRLFPQKKRLLLRELENIETQIEQKERDYIRDKTEGLRKLSLANKNELERMRLELKQKKIKLDDNQKSAETYSKLYESAGHGGISKQQLMEKQAEYNKAENEFQQKQAELENLEIKFSGQRTEAGVRLNATHFDLLRLRLEYENKKQQIDNEELQVENSYQSALAEWEAAAQVNLEDLDADNFLKIRSPLSGEVTYVAFRQAGEKVRGATPMVSVAPVDSRKALRVGIPDKDRGLLKVGQSVKVKFAAFPYQRYGFIEGNLAYLSPAAKMSQRTAQPQAQGQQGPLYEGRVSLEKDFYLINGEEVKLRYGMTAVTEIVVQKRRLVDLLVDPFRRLKG
jgi:HlyD family secretion protein